MKQLTLSLLAALAVTSCATGPNAQTGAVVGALGGAAAGGIIGNQSGRGLEGAVIGGALGAAAGNAIGNSQDMRNEQQYYNRGNRGYREPQQRYYTDDYGRRYYTDPYGRRYMPNGQPYYY
jgi:uncharacterized protein YcfJ